MGYVAHRSNSQNPTTLVVGVCQKNLQYLRSFANQMATLRKKHIIHLFNAPDWYTKVNVRLTDEFTLEPNDKMYDDFEAVRKECSDRISKMIFRTSPLRTTF